MKVLLITVLLFSSTWLQAASPVCNEPGENYVGWPTVNPVWEMCYLSPADSSAADGSSLEVRKVHFNGYLALERIHVPMLFASYESSTCYRDWKDIHASFLAADQIENPTRPAITTCDASTDPTQSVGDCPFQDPNGSGTIGDKGDCFSGVQVEKYEDRLVLVTNHSAAWYKYASKYIFHADGRIQPRFGFGNSDGTSNNIKHWHTGYWRVNFDIDGPENDEVFINEGQSSVLQTVEFSDLRHDTSGQEPVPLTDLSWTIKDNITGRGYRVVPETEGDQQEGFVDEFALTVNPSGRDFHMTDVMATQYKLINGTLPEYSDTPGSNGLFNCSMLEDNLVNNEALTDENVVFWYRTAVFDDKDIGLLCKTGGPTFYPLGDWGVDQLPSAVVDTVVVEKNSIDNVIDVLTNDTDPDGGDKLVDAVTQPDNGTVTIGVNGENVLYTPDMDYCNNGNTTDDFTYTLNGGSVADVLMGVDCLDLIFEDGFE